MYQPEGATVKRKSSRANRGRIVNKKMFERSRGIPSSIQNGSCACARGSLVLRVSLAAWVASYNVDVKQTYWRV